MVKKRKMQLKHASLFSGIGGFDLAAQWMGWENVFHCEWNEFGKKVLKYYWPEAISYDDITKTDFTIHRGTIDVLTGGFPCQPYSMAGKRKGKEDDRHLWPEMLRAIREIQPRWVVGENVFGLINWNGGLVFNEVQADLEAAGYEVWPYVLPACAVNAPHRRDRVWFVAHNKNDKRNRNNCGFGGLRNAESLEMENAQERLCLQNRKRERRQEMENDINASTGNQCSKRRGSRPYQQEETGQPERKFANCIALGEQPQQGKRNRGNEAERQEQVVCSNICEECKNTFGLLRHERGSNKCKKSSGTKSWTSANPEAIGMERCRTIGEQISKTYGRQRLFMRNSSATNWTNWPTQSPVCSGHDGISERLDFAAVFGSVKHPRQPARAFGKWRNESIKAFGNAIVPQVVHQIFKTIEQYENNEY